MRRLPCLAALLLLASSGAGQGTGQMGPDYGGSVDMENGDVPLADGEMRAAVIVLELTCGDFVGVQPEFTAVIGQVSADRPGLLVNHTESEPVPSMVCPGDPVQVEFLATIGRSGGTPGPVTATATFERHNGVPWPTDVTPVGSFSWTLRFADDQDPAEANVTDSPAGEDAPAPAAALGLIGLGLIAYACRRRQNL